MPEAVASPPKPSRIQLFDAESIAQKAADDAAEARARAAKPDEPADEPAPEAPAAAAEAPAAEAGQEHHDEPAAEVKPVVTISLGDPKPEEDELPEGVRDNKAVRQMRERIKELNRIAREKDEENKQLKSKLQPAQTELGPRPTLADAGYDEEAYASRVIEWNERKRKVDEAQAAQRAQAEESQRTWLQSVEAFNRGKAALAKDDYEEAEIAIRDRFDQTQIGILISASKMPAEMAYALGHNPEKLAELAKIKDPVRFAAEIGRMEAAELKVTRSSKPAPERKIVSAGSPAAGMGGVQEKLEKLRAEAERTGNYTPVIKFKRENGLH